MNLEKSTNRNIHNVQTSGYFDEMGLWQEYKAVSQKQIEESKKYDLELRKRNLGMEKFKIDDRTQFNKSFMLEVQFAGYDPNDSEDIDNYLNNLPSKTVDRNLIVAGVGRFDIMGQSEYEEDELDGFIKKNPHVEIGKKSNEDFYLTSKIPDAIRQDLIEHNKNLFVDFDFDRTPKPLVEKRSFEEVITSHRQNLARQLGSDEIEVNFKPLNFINTTEQNNKTNIIKSSVDPNKIIDLIKELRALGFTPEEIKEQIKKL